MLGAEQFPYAPDLLLGHKGQKMGIFVLKENEFLRDTGKPDGRMQFRFRLIERAHHRIEAGQ